MNSREPTTQQTDPRFDPTTVSWQVPNDLQFGSTIEDNPSKGPSHTEQPQTLSLQLLCPDVNMYKPSARRFQGDANQRQFTRCPIPEERTAGILTIDGRSFNCQLIEMSIGGFGVILPMQLKLTHGAVGNLRAPGLHYVVSVTRHEARPTGFYVGLKQLEEIVDRQDCVNRTSPLLSYLLASVSGALVATVAYFFMYGS